MDDLSFSVPPGRMFGFVGRNGAGKTTTMRIITGYMPATEGQAIVAGHDVFAEPLEAKRRIGYLPETPPLYPEMTVREYLTFVARLKIGKITAADCAMRVDHTMKKARVDDMADRHCGKLSKGYKQRVGLAQALIHDPEVLILDEPTAGLDPKQIMETRDLIKSLAGNHTIVLSTHILPEVAQTCTRVVIINKGRIAAVDTTENLTHERAASLYVQVEAPEDAVAAALGAVPGVRQVVKADRHDTWIGFEVDVDKDHDIRRDLARTIVNKGWGLLELRPTRASLEDVFLQLTTEEMPQGAPGAAESAEASGATNGEAANG